MTTVTVKFVNEKEGKRYWGIKDVNDKWYSFDHNKLSFTKGKTYDCEIETSDEGYHTIKAAKPANGSGAAAGTGAGSGAAFTDRWWINATSNWVAHAIAGGHITEPGQIKAWAAAAKLTLEEIDAPVKKREPGDDDDRTPF